MSDCPDRVADDLGRPRQHVVDFIPFICHKPSAQFDER
jgi:hypothetical protein